MSFFLTTEQVRNRTKTVTRRLGWKNAKVGDVVQPVVKGQGLKKGETAEKIGGPIRFVNVERVPLAGPTLTFMDVAAEGFPELTPEQFGLMFCQHNDCDPDEAVTRIEFEYLR